MKRKLRLIFLLLILSITFCFSYIEFLGINVTYFDFFKTDNEHLMARVTKIVDTAIDHAIETRTPLNEQELVTKLVAIRGIKNAKPTPSGTAINIQLDDGKRFVFLIVTKLNADQLRVNP
jgi:hypothetical protein